MKTRIGKIAHIPHHLREQLNLRLFNGARGPELMKWLNALPEVQEVLADFFNASPINRQNLTEWRHGGYEEWLRHQERELRIQRIAEEGRGLNECEGNDLFENAARIAVAELMADMDTLHELRGEKRTQRLRNLTWELARLQNAYNRSRWAALAWTKWNDRFLGPDAYENDEANEKIPAPAALMEPQPLPSRRENAQTLSVSKDSEHSHLGSCEIHEPALPPIILSPENAPGQGTSGTAIKLPTPPHTLELPVKQQDQPAELPQAERAEAREPLSRSEGKEDTQPSAIKISLQEKLSGSPEFKQIQTISTGAEVQACHPPDSVTAVAAAPPQTPANGVEQNSKTPSEIAALNARADFLRQAALRRSFRCNGQFP